MYVYCNGKTPLNKMSRKPARLHNYNHSFKINGNETTGWQFDQKSKRVIQNGTAAMRECNF
jgi:hypothetical protein